MMKYIVPSIAILCFALTSCRTPPVKDADTLTPDDTFYALCSEAQAELILLVDFEIGGLASRQKEYYFPRPFGDRDLAFPSMSMVAADGARGGYNLSYGLSEISAFGVIFEVSCSYTHDYKSGSTQHSLVIPWLESLTSDTNGIRIHATWKDKRPNKASQVTSQ